MLDDVVTAPAVLEKPEKSSSKDLPLDLAPGCFGFGLLYNRDKEICGGCPFNDECAKRALPIRERLRNEIGLRFPEERKKRAKPAPKAVAEPKAEAKPSCKPKKTAAERVRECRKRTKHLIGANPSIVTLWRAEFRVRVRKLIGWLKAPKPSISKAKFRSGKSGRQIALDWYTYQKLAAELGHAPSPSEFAKELGVNRHAGRDRLRRLTAMEAGGGPWA